MNNTNLNVTFSGDFDREIYAIWNGNSYTINYFNGTDKLAIVDYNYGENSALTTFENLGGTVQNWQVGWDFYGWTDAENSFSLIFQNGADITFINIGENFEITPNKSINLYAIYSRTITFVSGLSTAQTTTEATQYWNPVSTASTNLSSVLMTAPQTIELGSWTALGYRPDHQATTPIFTLTTAEITPPATSNNTLYAIYSRTITIIDLEETLTLLQYTSSSGATSSVEMGGI